MTSLHQNDQYKFEHACSLNMASPTGNQNTLAPLVTHWHNRSLSSVTSDAATFHSAHAYSSAELKSLSSTQNTQHPRETATPRPQSPVQHPLPPPKPEALDMNRKDSGYGAGQEPLSSSRRTSTSSNHRFKCPSKRTSSRPSSHRASRSSPGASQATRTSIKSKRPSLRAHHTTSTHQQSHQSYQFFQFPTLQSPEENTISTADPPPPATCQYWTSDSTRRLEYAAIDAASQGLRGFFIKLIPDCILPPSSRRTKFHCGDEASDAGSVRRYRLALPEEKEECEQSCDTTSRSSGLKRLTSAWKRGCA